MPKHEMVIGNNGSLRMIYADELAPLLALGKAEIRRASHVEPAGVRWVVNLKPVGGPRIGPFRTRAKALAIEHAWLVKHDIPFPEDKA